jgi:LysR family transcriptional regulator, regulator for genes of the gallate degradation pathway
MSMSYNDFPSLRQLRAFEAVARLQSMSGAAREINLSQPGVTQSVEALERELNGSLLQRRRSGCYPTKLGAILLPRVQCFFDQVRSAVGELIVSNPAMSRQTLDMTHKITKPQIRSLLAIYESESFDAAARLLAISQPSLHRSAKDLERELRRGLYHRTAKGMTTNARGSELARRIQLGLREIHYGIEEMKAAQGNVISRIAIGNIPHSDAQVLSAAIKELLGVHPNAFVQVVDGHYDTLLNDLRAARLDLLWGTLRTPLWAHDVREEKLFHNPYVIVARRRHPLARLKRIAPSDLTRFDWITPGPTTPRQQALEQLLRGTSSTPRITVETTSLQLHRNLIASGDRLALMSLFESRLNDPSIFTTLPFQSSHLKRSDGVVRRADWRPTRIHLQFLDMLRAHARRMSRTDLKLIVSDNGSRQRTAVG